MTNPKEANSLRRIRDTQEISSLAELKDMSVLQQLWYSFEADNDPHVDPETRLLLRTKAIHSALVMDRKERKDVGIGVIGIGSLQRHKQMPEIDLRRPEWSSFKLVVVFPHKDTVETISVMSYSLPDAQPLQREIAREVNKRADLIWPERSFETHKRQIVELQRIDKLLDMEWTGSKDGLEDKKLATIDSIISRSRNVKRKHQDLAEEELFKLAYLSPDKQVAILTLKYGEDTTKSLLDQKNPPELKVNVYTTKLSIFGLHTKYREAIKKKKRERSSLEHAVIRLYSTLDIVSLPQVIGRPPQEAKTVVEKPLEVQIVTQDPKEQELVRSVEGVISDSQIGEVPTQLTKRKQREIHKKKSKTRRELNKGTGLPPVDRPSEQETPVEVPERRGSQPVLPKEIEQSVLAMSLAEREALGAALGIQPQARTTSVPERVVSEEEEKHSSSELIKELRSSAMTGLQLMPGSFGEVVPIERAVPLESRPDFPLNQRLQAVFEEIESGPEPSTLSIEEKYHRRQLVADVIKETLGVSREIREANEIYAVVTGPEPNSRVSSYNVTVVFRNGEEFCTLFVRRHSLAEAGTMIPREEKLHEVDTLVRAADLEVSKESVVDVFNRHISEIATVNRLIGQTYAGEVEKGLTIKQLQTMRLILIASFLDYGQKLQTAYPYLPKLFTLFQEDKRDVLSLQGITVSNHADILLQRATELVLTSESNPLRVSIQVDFIRQWRDLFIAGRHTDRNKAATAIMDILESE